MNNWIKTSGLLLVAALTGVTSFAQDAKDKSGKSGDDQEIIIRKKEGKAGKTTIVIDGDKITINGKPIDEYKNENLTILRRDIRDNMAPRLRSFNLPQGGARMFEDMDLPNFKSNKALLGVMTEKAEGGAKIHEVSKESGAEKAGLKKDDIITKVEDTKVESPADLVEAIGKYKPNDKVGITYKRDNKESKTTVTLGENKSRPYAFNFNEKDFDVPFPPNAPDTRFFNMPRRQRLGLAIQDVEEGKGVKVNDVEEDSPAAKAGLKEGDVVTEVNGKEVAGIDDLRNEVRDLKDGDTVKITYKRGGSSRTAEIKIAKRLKSADL